MREQMPNRNRPPRFRRLGKIFCDAVIQVQLVFFDQHHDGSCRELLRHRSDLIARLGGRRAVKLKISEAVTTSLYNLTVADDPEREAGDVQRTQRSDCKG